jgi:hypothetical protein
MKPFSFLLIAGATLAVSCQQSGTTTEQTSDSIVTSTDTAATATTSHPAIDLRCFTQTAGKDKASLFMKINNDSVTGHLEYHRHEKDSNEGDFEGTIQNNIISVQYHFMSEGMMSTRQEVFKLEGERMYTGLPASFNNQGEPVFEKDPANIKFDTIPFVKVLCP